MISLSHLQKKLNIQAKYFALILEVPDLIAEGLIARGLYNFSNFGSAHQSLITEYSDNKLSSLYQHDTFKYLFINEFDDDEIIDDLHQNIETMAARIERLDIIDKTPIDIISAIYKTLRLHDESKFIINTGSVFRLNWQPYFETLTEPSEILFADVKVHSRTYRLIASKYPLEVLSYNNLEFYWRRRLQQDDKLTKEAIHSEKEKIEEYKTWLIKTLKCFVGDEIPCAENTPTVFKISGKRYLVFGFMVPPHKARKADKNKPQLKLNIRNISGVQKYIVKIDQQALVFEAQIIQSSIIVREILNDHQLSISKSLMTHCDAGDKWFKYKEQSFSTVFRPATVGELFKV